MIKVIYAASWLARRRFYSFSHELYEANAHWSEPEIWQGRKVLTPAHNELMRFPHAFLLAVEDNKILARTLTGTATGERGYFAMFDARPRVDAVRALMDEAAAWQRRQGSGLLVGPIAPTMADLGGGVLHDGFEECAAFCDAYNADYYDELLTQCGFRVESEWLSYRFNLGEFERERYGRAAEWAAKRFGYETTNRLCGRPETLAETLFCVMEGQIGWEEAKRLAGRTFPFLAAGLCPVVTVKKRPVGFLLTMEKGGRNPRIVSLWVRKEWRGKGVTAVLFDALAREAERRGIAAADGSMIRSDNMASWLGAERAGGSVKHRYYQYQKRF